MTPAPLQVESLLANAMEKRSVGCTALNEQSSRSHMVFTLKIDGSNSTTGARTHTLAALVRGAGACGDVCFTHACSLKWSCNGAHTPTHAGQQIHGVLNLIDLAGSERVKDSGASGQVRGCLCAVRAEGAHMCWGPLRPKQELRCAYEGVRG